MSNFEWTCPIRIGFVKSETGHAKIEIGHLQFQFGRV